ncbi:MAG: hypothetical protein ACRD9L_23950 [Bryobacteraceae bacterium]
MTDLTHVRAVLAYKNFAANKGISHIGLGVAAMNTSKVLRRERIEADVWPIVNAAALRTRLEQARTAAGQRPVTHVVISAPWIPTPDLQALVSEYPNVQFSVNCHSNVGFLQADANGVRLLREAIEIERGTWNFHVAGNSEKFCQWVTATYQVPCAFLPNLYYLDHTCAIHRPLFHGGTLRVGAFGATRPLKNLMSACGAAIEIATSLKTDLEIWMSAGRTEGGGATILNAAHALLGGLPHVKLVENGWQSWPKFRGTVRHMHLLMQPSYTESFNMVTADGVAEGVPSVVSDAITWAPEHWKASIDDVIDIARVGRHLLFDHRAAEDGLRALQTHNLCGARAWTHYLSL